MALFLLAVLLFTGQRETFGTALFQKDAPHVEESCVMSFVIPKDKVKSSCQTEDRMNRKMNFLESKLNMYRQEVNQLQVQLQKERHLCQSKLRTLEEKLSSFDYSEKYNALARKLEGLETVWKKGGESFERENKYSGSRQINKPRVGYKKNSEREELENLVKPIVISEIENYLENITVIAEKRQKVNSLQDNIIADNWLRNDQSYVEKSGLNVTKSKTAYMMKELEEIKSKLNETGDQVAVRVGTILKNVTIKADVLRVHNVSSNGTSENNTLLGVENMKKFVDLDQKENVDKGRKNLGRMSIEGGVEPQADQEQDNTNLLVANLYTDELEEILRGEINMLLQTRMEEVISLMRKQSANLVNVVDQNSKEINKIEEQNEEKLKRLQDKIDGLRLEVSSLSQTVQDFYTRLEKIPSMKELMDKIKKNVTLFSRQRNQDMVIKVDEHEKKLRTLDRLYGIFQPSLQHYRNESKMAYQDLKIKLENLEVNLAREVALDLYINITSKLGRAIERYNSTLTSRIQAMGAGIRNLEDNSVLFQMDLKNLERRHKSKTGKLEEDYKQLDNRVNRLQNQNRKLHENVNNLKSDQRSVQSDLNSTMDNLQELETELKLDLLETWMEYNFDYDTTRTECFGRQYIRRTKYNNGRLAGVVLCNNMRYKIMLANSMSDKFQNVGDIQGFGEDHCEFVGATTSSIVKLSTPAMSMKTEDGFARESWGQEPKKVRLNFLRPSPAWYECGIRIP